MAYRFRKIQRVKGGLDKFTQSDIPIDQVTGF